MVSLTFAGNLYGRIQEDHPEELKGAIPRVHPVTKFNDRKLTALTVRFPDGPHGVTVYLDDYYRRYQHGAPLDRLAEEAGGTLLQARERMAGYLYQGSWTERELFTYSLVRDRLILRLCDPGSNKEYLAGMAHTPVLDGLEAIYAVDMGWGQMPATTGLLTEWDITPEQLHQDAMAVLRRHTPALYSMESVLSLSPEEMRWSRLPAADLLEPGGRMSMDEFKIPMFILQDKFLNEYGASLILRERLMEQIGDRMGGDYYVLPSSIHEVIIVPEGPRLTGKDLADTVRDINAWAVGQDDFLSDTVQYYDRAEGRLMPLQKHEETARQKARAETATRHPGGPGMQGPSL